MHDVQALISKTEALAHAAAGLKCAVLCKLPQGFSLLPITDELKEELNKLSKSSAAMEAPIEELAPGLLSLALNASKGAPVAYVCTEYFGGQGGQDAASWLNESLQFSPKTIGYNSEWPNSSISQALRAIGVVAEDGKDEFDTVGLGLHRSTERWAKAHEGGA